MRKLVIAAGLTMVFPVGSFAAMPANEVAKSAGYATGADSAVAPARNADQRLRFIDQTLYPTEIAVQGDWLCDGMTPCVELS
jgi:hypothetical protein